MVRRAERSGSLKLACGAAVVLLACAGCGGSSNSGPAGSSGSATSSTGSTTTTSHSSGSATLSWEAPTTDTNGAPVTNLAGYRIYYGSSPRNLDQTVELTGLGVQTYVIADLAAGTWYFAIRAFTTGGTESALSDIVSLTIN